VNEIAANLGITAIQIESVDQSGRDPKGADVQGILDRNNLLTAAFSLPANGDSGLKDLPDRDGYYVVKVEAPNIDGKHDDYSDALCRMIWIASQNAANRSVVFGNKTGSVQYPSRLPSGNLSALQRARQSGSHESRMIPRLSNRPRWR
jgi:hypothetical protein